MNRRIRPAALIALVLVFPVMASCLAVGKTAAGTPVPSAAGKGPVIANFGPPQVNLAKCAVGAQNEPLQNFGLKMTSSTSGWALGQCTLAAQPSFPNGSTINCYQAQAESMGILRTSDGGATWTDVSPPSVTNRTWHHSQFFLDANHAWVGEVSRTADACASQVTMFMTADGGRSWQQGGIIPIKTGAPTDDVFNVAGPTDYMDFIDLQHGWLMVVSPPSNPTPGSMVTQATLYATADGGLHWRALGINPGSSAATGLPGCQPTTYMPASDVSFQSATTGWLEIYCPAITMLTTRDGGASWVAKALPTCACQVLRPQFFDANHALITGEQGSPVMLSTADAGATWAQRRVPQAAMTEFSFIDPSNGWMVGIAQLAKSYETIVYRTADGGQTWSPLGKPGFATAASNPNVYFPIVSVQFVNANDGFVVLGAEAQQNGQLDPSAPQLQVLSTADGGLTWNVVLKQIPEVPCTARYQQLNGSVNLSPAKLASSTTAWAQGGLRTTDGGAHWRDVSSPALREGSATPLYPSGYTDFFLDGDHAWQAGVYGSKATCSDHVTTFATADGGKTWQPSTPVALNLPSGYNAGAMQLGFTSAQSGWLWIPMYPASGDPFGFPATGAFLDTTTDGGLTWSRVAELSNSQLQHIPVPAGSQGCKPSLGQITFSSSTVGFLSVNCADPGMLVTREGGVTWKTLSGVNGNCQCSPSLPTFVDANRGFMQIYGVTSGAPGLLGTTDGGATWRALPPLPSSGFIMAITFVDAGNLWVLVTPPGWTKISGGKDSLYKSGDGGQTWNLVQAGVPLGRVYGLVVAAGGVAMAAQPRNATWSYDTAGFATANDTVLAVTTDGGHSWKVFSPAISS